MANGKDAGVSQLGGRESPNNLSSASSSDRLSPFSGDGSPLSSGLSVDSHSAPLQEVAERPSYSDNEDGYHKKTASEPDCNGPADTSSSEDCDEDEDFDGPEPSSPLLSTLQHEIEWCRSYPATNSNWVPVRFSFGGKSIHSQ